METPYVDDQIRASGLETVYYQISAGESTQPTLPTTSPTNWVRQADEDVGSVFTSSQP